MKLKKTWKLASVLLSISYSSFAVAQEESNIAFLNSENCRQYEHVDSLKRDITAFYTGTRKESLSLIAQYEKEILLFQVLPKEDKFYLLSFNPEPYDVSDFEWNKLYKVYGFDADFNLLNISTFSGQNHIKSQLYRVDGVSLLIWEYRWSNEKLVFGEVKSFIESLDVLLRNLHDESNHNESTEDLTNKSLCANYYLRLFADICQINVPVK